MDENYIVTKSNKLITCNYDLSLQEQKIILTLASMVQPQDTEFKEYEIKIKDFISLLGLKDQSKYTELPKITKELKKKVFEIREGSDLIQVSWLGSVRYKTKEGMLILSLDKNLKPYMLDLKELYTTYKLENILNLKSKYSIRMFEILKSNLYKKTIDVELEELKNMVNATEKTYNTYANFKSKILIKAQKELKNKTDISFEFKEIKTGRKVTSLKFYINTNNIRKAKESITLLPTVDEEISATLIELEEETPIKKVMDIMSNNKITSLEAKKIYDSSKRNLEIIKKVYDYGKNKEIPNFIGWMINMVKPGVYIEPKKNHAKGSFNDYEQRQYDFDELEKRLLGWDNNKMDEAGEEYQQRSMINE